MNRALYYLFHFILVDYSKVSKVENIFVIVAGVVTGVLFPLFMALISSENKHMFMKLLVVGVIGSVADLCFIWIVCCGLFTIDEKPIHGGNLYIGQAINQIPNGWGAEYSQDGKIIRYGYFEKGVLNGAGREFAAKIEKNEEVVYITYEGEFSNGIYSGEGELYDLFDGNIEKVYSGFFLNGKKNGKGESWFYNEKDELIYYHWGSYSEGVRSGYGINYSYDENGLVVQKYEGNFYNDQKSGKGVLGYLSAKGEKLVYIGPFYQDRATGDGIFYNMAGQMVNGDNDFLTKNIFYNIWERK